MRQRAKSRGAARRRVQARIVDVAASRQARRKRYMRRLPVSLCLSRRLYDAVMEVCRTQRVSPALVVVSGLGSLLGMEGEE